MHNRRWFRLLGAAFLLAIGVGIVDCAMAMWQQIKINNAAAVGAQWGAANGYNERGVTAAAQTADRIPGITVSSANPCGCATNNGITEVACNSLCPAGGSPQIHVVVTARICHKPLVPWPGLSYCSSGNSQCAAAGCAPNQIVLSTQSIALQ